MIFEEEEDAEEMLFSCNVIAINVDIRQKIVQIRQEE